MKEIFSEIESCGYEHYIHKIGDHNFQPHADAPKHQNNDTQEMGIEFFNKEEYIFNKSCLIDLSLSNDSEVYEDIKYLIKITKEHLKPFEEILEKVGAILLRTGYDKWLENNKKHNPKNIPYLDKDAVDFINSFPNIKVIGIDSLTIDFPGDHYAHNKFTKNKLVVESMVNLSKIPKENVLNFTLMTKPVVITGATGGPIIAYAFIKR